MPTLAAVPSQRATQGTTKRPKRPNVVNESPAMVRVHKNTDKVVRISNQPSDVEYTVYTYQVNINQIDRQCLRLSAPKALLLCTLNCYIFVFRSLQYDLSTGSFAPFHIQFFSSINQFFLCVWSQQTNEST